MIRDSIKSKKGQGLSLTTIIIAIIVLVVLVVLILIFSGFFGTIFAPGVTDCAAKGGTCQSSNSCPSGGQISGGTAENPLCEDSGEVCCKIGADIFE